MASKEENVEEDDCLADISSIQQLMYELGRLKFSLRSIADMSLPVSLLQNEENKSPTDEVKNAESNRLLDKVLHEVLSKNNDDSKEESNNKTDKKTEKYITSIDELELVNEKLQDECEKMRLHCLNVLTGLGTMETNLDMTDAIDENDKCETINDHTDRNFLNTELEALNSIYINEIDVSKEDELFTSVSIDLHPATADNVDQQYVKMTLKFTLPEEYPDELPRITIRNPRGLSDEKLKSIIDEISLIAEEKKGNSMLFEIIEAAKEHLTSQNRPSGECAICLYGFSEQDIFTRTECYHYFHSHCLARYVKNILENAEESEEKDTDKSSELFCPMCRIPIKFSTSDEEYPPPTAINEETFNLTEEIVDLQKKMADLYQKQLEKGGIIDVEAERNKYLLEISDVPTQSTSVEKSDSKVMEHPSLDESGNAEPDAHQSPKDKAIVNEKNTKSSSRENFQGNSGRRKKFDPKYERKPDRYERRPDAYRQNNYGKYHRHRDGQFKNASSRTASQEHYSKKDAVQIDSEDQQPAEESTSEVNDPVNKNSDSPDSVKPKHTNNSDYRYNYNRNPRFNQRGRYQRYNNYSNNGSYNRDRRYDGSNNYYKFNYHNRKPHQSNDHFEEKFHDDVDKEGTQRSRGRYYKEKSNFDHKDQSQEDGDTEDTQRSRGRYYKEKSNFDHRDQFQEDGDKEDTQRSRGRYYKEKSNFDHKDKFQEDGDKEDMQQSCGRYYKEKSNYDRKDRFQEDIDKEDTQRSGGRHFKERSNYDRKDKFQDDVDREDMQRSGGRYFKERNNYDHKFQHKNEKANDSDRNSSEKYSSNANQRKEQHVRKNDLPSERTPQKNVGGDCSENTASDDLDKTEVENSQENKSNPRRSKNYSNYNSSHNYGNDTQYHDKYDYNNRSSRYQRNPNKSYNYGHYSPQNGGYKNYGSEKWQNRPYQKKSSEDFKQEAVAKESESQIKKPVVERNVESSLAPNRSGAEKSSISEMTPGGSPSMLRPPPGFANPASRVHYGLKAANPPPGFSKS